MNIDALLEAERRGILPENKRPLLAEARKRGLLRDVSSEAPVDDSMFPQPRTGMEALEEARRTGALEEGVEFGRELKGLMGGLALPGTATLATLAGGPTEVARGLGEGEIRSLEEAVERFQRPGERFAERTQEWREESDIGGPLGSLIKNIGLYGTGMKALGPAISRLGGPGRQLLGRGAAGVGLTAAEELAEEGEVSPVAALGALEMAPGTISAIRRSRLFGEAPQRLMESVIPRRFIKKTPFTRERMAEEMLERGIKGRPTKVGEKAQERAYEIGEEITRKLEPLAEDVISPDPILAKIGKETAIFRGKGAVTRENAAKQIDKWVAAFKDQGDLTVKEANQLRKDLNRLQSRAWQRREAGTAGVLPGQSEFEMAQSQGLREALTKAVPDLDPLLKEQSFQITLRDMMEDIAERGASPGKLRELLGIGVGAELGGAGGALAFPMALRMAESPTGRMAGAQTLQRILNLLGPVETALTPLGFAGPAAVSQ